MQELIDSDGEVVTPVELGDHGATHKYPLFEDPDSIKFMHEDLERSGLVSDDLPCYPISKKHFGTRAYVLPNPNNPKAWQVRIDRVRNKYIGPSDVRDIYIPRGITIQMLRNAPDIWAIEGVKKLVKFLKENPQKIGIAFPGAWNLQSKGRLLPSLVNICHPDLRLHVIFDGDINVKTNIQQAATDVIRLLTQIHVVPLLYRPKEGYKGIDDQLVAEPSSSTDLVVINDRGLEETKKRLFMALGCGFNSEGQLILSDLNAKIILEHHFGEALVKDRRRGLIYNGRPINLDELEAVAGTFMQGHVAHGYSAHKIANGLAWAKSAIPTTDFIVDLIKDTGWDGTERLNTWAETYLPCTWQKHANDVARIFMTGWGLRILQPGTQHDTVFGLVGPQGGKKTTFFEDLATFGGQTFYQTVQDVPKAENDGSRTIATMLAQCILADLAEGVVVQRAGKKESQGLFKQFLTDKDDRYRGVYARSVTIVPRGYSFVGTANSRPAHSDKTGTRRFDYLEPTDIAHIPYDVKLQLLAEVFAKEKELRASRWYDLTITREDLPEWMLEGNEHIQDVHEIINQSYMASDPFAELLERIMHEAPLTADTKVPFMSGPFIAAKMGGVDVLERSKFASSMLTELSSSLHFPYTIKTRRITETKLLHPKTFDPFNSPTEHWREHFKGDSTNHQIRGWEFIRRESVSPAPQASHSEPVP